MRRISLPLRLSLTFTGLLSIVLILLVVGLNIIFNIAINKVLDDHLQITASQVLNALRVDETGAIIYTSDAFTHSEDYFFQVWSQAGELLLTSKAAAIFSQDVDFTADLPRETFFETVRVEEARYRVLISPINISGNEYGWLRVGHKLSKVINQQKSFSVISGLSCLVAIVVAGLASWISNRYMLKPLTDFAQITQQITATDDFSKRIPERGQSNDVVDELTENFNKTLDRLEGLIDMERRFMAYVSHELRTPLTVIKGNVGLMRITKTVDQESLNSIETEVDRLTRLVTDLLLIEQTEMGDSKLLREPIEIDDLLMEVFKELKVLSGGAHDIQIMNIEPAVVRGVRDRLKQVLLNLGSNAVNYSPEGGKILLDLEIKSPWVKLRIIDEGVGIPRDELDNLFERFYRGRNVLSLSKKNVGFGLGLAIANNIVRNHGGHIDLDSVEGKGTTILVWLPLSMIDIPTRPIDQILEG